MAWKGVAAGWLALAATACAFDSNTIGETAGVGSTSGEGTSTSATTITSTSVGPTSSATTEASTNVTTTPDTTGEPQSESGGGSSTTESVIGTESSGTTGIGTTTDSCEAPATFSHLLWVKDLPNAAISGMEVVESMSIELDGEPVLYARSLTADVGSVTFEFDTECEGELYLWGLVWDWVPASTEGPDSYWYGLDADATAGGDAWVYGCTTSGVSGWSWEALRHYNGSPCDTDPLVPTIEGGPHAFMLLNREPGSTGFEIYDFAGVAAIAISNDAAYDPYSDYTP